MRRELVILTWVNIGIFFLTLYLTMNLLTLAVDNAMNEALSESELNYDPKNDTRPDLIPKIIHQTYKTTEIPEHWKDGQKRCIDLHPDYEYILWTDAMALEFIEKNYPWFLKQFKKYKYPIQRADAIRYFVLAHYGGIYIDLDDGCERRLDPLLKVPAFVRKTSPTGVSNDVMGSIPNHPYLLKLQKALKGYDRNWYIPYITILSSTGPMFISLVWTKYKRWGVKPGTEVRILLPQDYKMHPLSFFSISKGSSWHQDDAHVVKQLASHILSCVVAGFIGPFIWLYFEYWFYIWLCNRNNNPATPSRTILFFRRFSALISKVLHFIGIKDNDEAAARESTCARTSVIQQNEASSSYTAKQKPVKHKRKDSNVPFLNVLADLEKNASDVTDLVD